MNRQRILLAQRANVELYPPVLHQASLLSELGEVTLVDALARNQQSKIQTPAGILRVRVVDSDSGMTPHPVVRKLRWVKNYVQEFRRELKKLPDAVIAYEPEAASILLSTAARTKRAIFKIVHLHELPEKELYYSFSGKMALKYLIKNLHQADLVVVPDFQRAEFVKSLCRLKTMPLVVMNCPRRLPELPASSLTSFLREKNIETQKIVHYQGAVGADHNLENVILSMKYWPPDAVFVIVGASQSQYQDELKTLAQTVGALDRVIFTGRVPYEQVFKYAVGATVGVTFLLPSSKNWELSAGASNKRFEYVALGLPQVTNDGPGIRELFEEKGVASVSDYNQVEEIGKKISLYLENSRLVEEVAGRARKLHLAEYNYERQFEPVMQMIASRQFAEG